MRVSNGDQTSREREREREREMDGGTGGLNIEN